ncbi:MAG TPA: DUF424 family protein [Candidatus Krumholzibacteriaceae bacterium]|nr:DUF424 family protein [Candidatus Krumholzibacteriaceae bacterium]
MDVYVNIRRTGKHVLLATCDAELLGKTLKEGKITFHVHEKFYKGTRVTLDEAVELIKQSTVVNMIGQKIVKKAIEHGFVHPEAVLMIEGIPHAQIIKI